MYTSVSVVSVNVQFRPFMNNQITAGQRFTSTKENDLDNFEDSFHFHFSI